MSTLPRRALLFSGVAVVVVASVGLARRAAARAQLVITVPDASVGAIVAAVAGTSVKVVPSASDDPGTIEVDGEDHPAIGKIVLKGSGAARRRFLDDARNAPSFGAAVRDLLSTLDPGGAAGYAERHKAWSRPFARQVLKWNTRLATSPVAGKSLADPSGRVYLLEWAGAKVGKTGSTPAPASLGKLPSAAAKPTIAAYTAYIEALVGALT